MANKANAEKALRQSMKRGVRNTLVRNRISWLRRQYQRALAAKDAPKAQELFRALQKNLDRAAGKGVMKHNTVSRLKARGATKLKTLA